MAGLVLAGLALALAACAGPVRNAHVPQPAKPVVAQRYVGFWHEVARYDQAFEKDCEAATASYALRPDGRVAVVNSCRKGGPTGGPTGPPNGPPTGPPTGPLEAIRGVATVVPGSDGAKLKVRFFHGLAVGDYWVLDHDDAYSWSIVGEGSGRYLWLLARDPLDGAQRDALIARAAALGYDVKALHVTRQAGRG